MYSTQNSVIFSYLSKVPNLTGYMVLSEDGAILASYGDLIYDQKIADIVHRMAHVPIENVVPKEAPSRLMITFDHFFYSVVTSAKKVFVAKIDIPQEDSA